MAAPSPPVLRHIVRGASEFSWRAWRADLKRRASSARWLKPVPGAYVPRRPLVYPVSGPGELRPRSRLADLSYWRLRGRSTARVEERIDAVVAMSCRIWGRG